MWCCQKTQKTIKQNLLPQHYQLASREAILHLGQAGTKEAIIAEHTEALVGWNCQPGREGCHHSKTTNWDFCETWASKFITPPPPNPLPPSRYSPRRERRGGGAEAHVRGESELTECKSKHEALCELPDHIAACLPLCCGLNAEANLTVKQQQAAVCIQDPGSALAPSRDPEEKPNQKIWPLSRS